MSEGEESLMEAPTPHIENQAGRQTILSPCRKYRYTLWREWQGSLDMLASNALLTALNEDKFLMVIGLNPSTADETKDDPTIRKCIGFAKRWGYGALCMTNLFAWRDTKPENMLNAADPIGPLNDRYLFGAATRAGMILAAWGKKGNHMHRASFVGNCINGMVRPDGLPMLHCLRANGDGSPEHPLYVPYETTPMAWPVQDAQPEPNATSVSTKQL